MPLYQVHHAIPLTDKQQDDIAEAITVCHTSNFDALRIFVNVVFIDARQGGTRYVAGKRRITNMIIATVRHGPSRTPELYQKVMKEIGGVWTDIVGNTGDKELRGVVLQGGIVAGTEAGFIVPPAGHDAEFLRENYVAFEKLAEGGDEDFLGVMEELRTREAFKGILPGGK